MSGTATGYAVDPVGESVFGVVLAGAMRVRRGRERLVFGPGDVCAWDPSAAHRGAPYGSARWPARLVRDARLAQRFVHLHRVLERPSWALEREVLLADWLHDVCGGERGSREPRRARQDPALRRACELLHDELATNVTLGELERAAGVSRHRLSRLFRAAF